MDTASLIFDEGFAPSDILGSKKARNRKVRKAERESDIMIKTRRNYPLPLEPKTEMQREYLRSLRTQDLVFAIGGAGTGKTYVGARFAIQELALGNVSKIILTRPTAARKEHKMGFLPGDQKKKIEPWLVPLVSSMKEGMAPAKVDEYLRNDTIEFAPFEFMRGRTFKDCIVILDEAQNCSLSDLRLFLTRIGEDARVIISGDTDQVDIEDSGLAVVVDMVRRHNITADVIEFGPADVVRSKLAREWVTAFAKDSKKL